MQKNSPSFSGDAPLKYPDQDGLGYAPFAKQMATVLVRMVPTDGLVMSINGEWGSGKSTILNFIKYYIEQLSENERPIVLNFNPWWFSGREDLTRLLIGQIRARLGDKDFGELKSRLADLAELVSKIPSLPGREVGGFFADKLRGQPDITALKESIGKLLIEQKKKILVLIDDIDRLSPEEIHDLFRTIKATANFPNVIYLLAFDLKIVIEALEHEFVASGKSYLEKIIQVPFQLPLPDKASLRRLLFDKLDSILANTPEGLFNHDYWVNAYFDGIDNFINTPRDILRLSNVLRATYPALEGEVNPVDFIAVEALRVFTPGMYEIIRNNQELLAGIPRFSVRGQDDHKIKAIYESWLNQVSEKDRAVVTRLLSRIFPQFAKAFGGSLFSGEYLSIWRKQLRACSPEIFPAYFRFGLPPDAITLSEMKGLLEKASDEAAFSEALIQFASQHRQDGITRLRVVLERLEDYTRDDIPQTNISPIVHSMFNIGDQLMKKEDEQRDFFDIGNDLRVGRVLHQLLSRLDLDTRFEIIFDAVTKGESISIAECEVTIYGQEHGKFRADGPLPEQDRTVNQDQLEKLEKLVLDKIRKAAKENILIDVPNLVSILHRWQSWTSDDQEVKAWVNQISTSDEGLVKLLRHFGHIQRAQTIGEIAVRRRYRLDPKWLEPFIDPALIVDRVRIFAKNESLDIEQLKAVKQFIEEYDMRQEGKDPNERF